MSALCKIIQLHKAEKNAIILLFHGSTVYCFFFSFNSRFKGEKVVRIQKLGLDNFSLKITPVMMLRKGLMMMMMMEMRWRELTK